jgi:hypothetical protein
MHLPGYPMAVVMLKEMIKETLCTMPAVAFKNLQNSKKECN